MAEALQIRKYAEGDRIFNQGEDSSEFYIIKEGAVDIVKGENEHVRSLSKLMCFGERAVLFDEPRSASAVATMP